MTIINEKPPALVWDGCHKHFTIDDDHTFYSYGDIIYNPAGIHIDKYFLHHEAQHTKQQAASGGPDAWWNRYFIDAPWRCEQEVEAYAAQYSLYCKDHKDKNQRSTYLWHMENALISGMYGLTMTRNEARAAIKARAKV